MKRGMTIEYSMCRADLNFEVDFWSKRRHWYDCDQVGSYCIRIMHRFRPEYQNFAASILSSSFRTFLDLKKIGGSPRGTKIARIHYKYVIS